MRAAARWGSSEAYRPKDHEARLDVSVGRHRGHGAEREPPSCVRKRGATLHGKGSAPMDPVYRRVMDARVGND